MRPPQRRPAPVAFRPALTLLVLYLGLFFLLFSFALVVPALWPLLEDASMRPGPEVEALARETARNAVQGRLGLAFGLAVIVTAAGGWLRILPGIGRPRA